MMIRTLLATTAMAGVIATSAYAQDATTPPPPTQLTPAAPIDTGTTAPTDPAQRETVAPGGSVAGGGTEMDRIQGETTTTGIAGVTDADTNATTAVRTGMTPVTDRAELTADNLIGTSVYGGNDADVGEIGDIALSPDGAVDAVIIDVGGFLGIGSKQVAVSMENLEFMQDSGGSMHLYTSFTEDQLENAEEYNAASYTENRDRMRLQSPGATDGSRVTQAPTGTVMPGTPATGLGTTDTATTASTGGVVHGMTSVTDQAELTAENLIGTTVYGPNEDSIGSIGDIVLSPEGEVDAVIVDVGGFLGIGAKPVAVSLDNLQFMQDASGSLYLYTQFTEDQLEAAMEYDPESYTANRDTMRIRSVETAGEPVVITD
jgi:sporulation protein YlmC with PRC-barrel domain